MENGRSPGAGGWTENGGLQERKLTMRPPRLHITPVFRGLLEEGTRGWMLDAKGVTKKIVEDLRAAAEEKEKQILEPLLEFLREHLAILFAESARSFGSYRYEQALPSSDIDAQVVLRPGVSVGLAMSRLWTLAHEHKDLCTKVL